MKDEPLSEPYVTVICTSLTLVGLLTYCYLMDYNSSFEVSKP